MPKVQAIFRGGPTEEFVELVDQTADLNPPSEVTVRGSRWRLTRTGTLRPIYQHLGPASR